MIHIRHMMGLSKKPNEVSETGFTLLEVMVAMSIIAIALTSIFHVQFQTILLNNNARFDISAPLLARSRMARIETMLHDVPQEENGDFGEKYPGYTWRHTIEDIESDTLGEAAGRLKKIEVVVSLNEDEFVYRIRAYRLQ